MKESPLEAVRLRTCSLCNPLGLGEEIPWLSWQCRSDSPNARQTAWQVLAADSCAMLDRDMGNLWDSGKVLGGQSLQIAWGGASLCSRQRVWWKVRVWDEDDRVSVWSETAFWEMGLLHNDDWQALWVESEWRGGKWNSSPAPYLRKSFIIEAAIVKARLYASALGLAEISLNGERVGPEEFFPGWTYYPKRVQYRVWDITRWLRLGENVIGVILGDGWYCGHVANFGRQVYGTQPRFLCQMEILLANDQRQMVLSGADWLCASGPLLESDLLMGECYDARLDLGAWNQPGYEPDDRWKKVRLAPAYPGQLQAMKGPPVVVTEEVRPTQPAKKLPGWNQVSYLFDLGQNMTGGLQVRLRAKAGKTIRIRYAEILDKEGHPYYENLRSARATDAYTFAGDEEEIFRTRFTFHGFRYVEIIGDPTLQEPLPENITALVLHSEVPRNGEFACSHPLLNQLHQNIDWSQRGNFLDIPTDCPQRDERLGWTGDAQMFIRTACFHRDVETFFYRWQQDLEDSQKPLGGVPPFIPDVPQIDSEPNDTSDAGPAWSDALLICPWTIYLAYGNRRILERHYPSMVRYVEFLRRQSQDLIRSHPEKERWGGFGDWLALDGSGKTDGGTRKDLLGTAFFAYSTELLAKIADVLGKSGDAERWRQWHREILQAFQRRFVTGDGLLAGATQTAYVVALHFGLLPKHQRAEAVRELVRSIRENGLKLATGFVGTPYLTRVLSDHGELDLAYQLLEQTGCPSWLFPVTLGATTIWERWDGWHPERGFQNKGMNSFNHYAYGAIGTWMYNTVAGLEIDPERPAYQHILFRPHPGGTLTWARASLETPYGLTAIAWKLADAKMYIALTIPANAYGTLRFPQGYAYGSDLSVRDKKFGSGNYQVELKRL